MARKVTTGCANNIPGRYVSVGSTSCCVRLSSHIFKSFTNNSGIIEIWQSRVSQDISLTKKKQCSKLLLPYIKKYFPLLLLICKSNDIAKRCKGLRIGEHVYLPYRGAISFYGRNVVFDRLNSNMYVGHFEFSCECLVNMFFVNVPIKLLYGKIRWNFVFMFRKNNHHHMKAHKKLYIRLLNGYLNFSSS